MKEEFYCLPLKKKVKAKITSVVKKKSYSLKGVHKVGDKSYNLNKTCSKARAEEVAEALGLEIEHPATETKASESAVQVTGVDDFLPEGSGNVIGQNSAGMVTAIPGTEETVNTNTTPFHSEDDDDGIGPMSMAAEEKKNCGCGKDPCITYGADGYDKSRSQSDEEESDDDDDEEESNFLKGALQDEVANDIPQGFDPTMEAEGNGGVGYAIEPDHWLRLQAHPEWQETREEVNVERENNFWVITAPQETADDLLELIIETSDTRLEDIVPVTSKSISTGVTLGIGVLGIAASIMLLRRLTDKSD
tara:strand:+ start:1694 stop:2608 length:915 start_codon:yes stop_codon:yes gene_type:complete